MTARHERCNKHQPMRWNDHDHHPDDQEFLKTYISAGIICLCVVQLVDLSKLNWKKVITSDGVAIGELEGGDVDTNSWQVTHVHVGLNDKTLKEFGLKKPYLGRVLICLPVDIIESVDDTVMLNESLQELKDSKECREFSVK